MRLDPTVKTAVSRKVHDIKLFEVRCSAYPFHELLERLEIEMVLEFSELADELIGVERGPRQQDAALISSKPVTYKNKIMFTQK